MNRASGHKQMAFRPTGKDSKRRLSASSGGERLGQVGDEVLGGLDPA